MYIVTNFRKKEIKHIPELHNMTVKIRHFPNFLKTLYEKVLKSQWMNPKMHCWLASTTTVSKS